MNYYLNRDSENDIATLGCLTDPQNNFICFTLELPWLNNAPQISCIPLGTYQVIRHNSPAHPHTWEITGVPNRSEILLHNGNTTDDTDGCILVGNSTGMIDGLPAVLNSVKTLEKLQGILPDTFELIIS